MYNWSFSQERERETKALCATALEALLEDHSFAWIVVFNNDYLSLGLLNFIAYTGAMMLSSFLAC